MLYNQQKASMLLNEKTCLSEFCIHNFYQMFEQVLISNQGCTEKTANHLIDVESTNLDLSGLIEEEAAVFANVK